MGKVFKGLCLVVCALAVQVGRPADQPPGGVNAPPFVPMAPPPPACAPAVYTKPGAKAPPDLSGRLPAADYLDSLFACADLWFFENEGLYKPPNDWLEADTKQYTELLKRGKFSWLVV